MKILEYTHKNYLGKKCFNKNQSNLKVHNVQDLFMLFYVLYYFLSLSFAFDSLNISKLPRFYYAWAYFIFGIGLLNTKPGCSYTML